MKVLELINLGAKELRLKKIDTSILDSELILSKILNKKREEMLINLDQEISQKYFIRYKKLILRRSQQEPIAYIMKEKEFWSKNFLVNPDTLIPRPETELMVEKLSKIFKKKKISILDVGTGSGCILISLLSELNNSKGVGIDISKKALIIAKKNSNRHGMQNRIKFLNKAIDSEFNHKFDLIVSNPPYIKNSEIENLKEDIKRYEPRIALDGGNDGLDLIKKVIYKTRYILNVKGTLALEIGNEQYKKVSEILIKNKFKIEHTIKDYKDNIRCIISTHIGSN
ncbi:peptide chain release factor N(5)-glutamine methyltransferase [Pelagibacteraceae bacterium]|jgi:release factor glutamine methyltransferase|nr:peptide chain release factor N(5)-glutamine methyltransferase [Pelagibacteraceae bacterium]MDC0952865.1 peptide chain release factor N(5)-glutamine methyltransferase [Pelagibacteraceae bacterium]